LATSTLPSAFLKRVDEELASFEKQLKDVCALAAAKWLIAFYVQPADATPPSPLARALHAELDRCELTLRAGTPPPPDPSALLPNSRRDEGMSHWKACASQLLRRMRGPRAVTTARQTAERWARAVLETYGVVIEPNEGGLRDHLSAMWREHVDAAKRELAGAWKRDLMCEHAQAVHEMLMSAMDDVEQQVT
jgi:hypothetical protein